MTYGLYGELAADILQIVGRSRESRNTASREGDLGGRGKLIDEIGITDSLAFRQDLDQIILVEIIKVMDPIGIIPEDTEVLCRRFQSGKTPYGLVTVGITLGIGVFRYTPDSLHLLICGHQFLH